MPLNNSDTRALLIWVRERGLSPEQLDELVYDIAGGDSSEAANQTVDLAAQEEAISGGEIYASNINNEGIESQVAFIASAYADLVEAQGAIEAAL